MAARELPWFRMWAAETLQSEDVGTLTHTEQVVWFRLLCVVALAEERGTTRINAGLAGKCMVTPAQLTKALNKMADLGMVDIREGQVTVVNWAKYQPPRKPSDEPEEVAERQRRSRAKRRDGHANVTRDMAVTSGVTDGDSAVLSRVTPSCASARAVAKESRDQNLLLAQEEDDSSRALREDSDFEPDPELVRAIQGIEGIGIPVTPFVAEEVRHYLDEGVPGEWIYLACNRAAGNGVRSWNYVRPILADWQRNGGPPPERERDGRGHGRGRVPGDGRGTRTGAHDGGGAGRGAPTLHEALGLE